MNSFVKNCHMNNIEIEQFTFSEVFGIRNDLPSNKFTVLDNIPYEHVKYGLEKHLCNLFNIILE